MCQKRQFLDPDTVRVVEHHEGQGPLLALAAGLGAEGEVLSPLTRVLRENNANFIVLDLKGFGHRHPSACRVTLAEAAAHAKDSGVIPDEPVIYVGHSAGSMAAIELALCDSNAIGVVMINGVLDELSQLLQHPFRHGWRHLRKAVCLARLLAYLTGWMPEFILRRLERPGHWATRLFRPMIARPDKLDAEALRCLVRYNRCKGALRHLLANRRYDLTSQGEELKVPVLAICGQSDPLATPPNKSEFLRKCTIPPIVVMVPTGHCSQLEEPHVVADAMIGFSSHPAP